MSVLRKLRTLRSGDEQIEWSKQGVLELKEKLKVKASRMLPSQDPPRVLFIGETGSGKSSFISSVVTALSGDVTYVSMIGEMQGREENTSKRYLEYRVFMGEEKEPLNFILCDARGIGKKNQLGVADREIERLMDGKLRHNDLIESERGSDGTKIDNRVPTPPSCVVFVQKAQRLGDLDKDVQEKLNAAADMARGRGMPCCVILTHIDVVKPTLTKKLHLALTNRTLQERVQGAAKEVGVNPNRVFLVKNYTTEERPHVRQDLLILRALNGILNDVSSRHRWAGGEGAGAGGGGGEDRGRAGEMAMRLLPPPKQLNRYQSSPVDDYSHSAASSRRSLDERHYSVFSAVSATDSGPNTSVSMQADPRLADLEKLSQILPRYHHHRFSSEPTQASYSTSRGGYEDMHFSEETTPKSQWSSEETFQKMKRGQEFVKYTIPKNQTQKTIYNGSDSDIEYNPEEAGSDDDDGIGYSLTSTGSDSDEGIGHSELSSDEESGEFCPKYLRRIVHALEKRRFPEDYNEEAHLQGAKPLFQPTVLQLKHSNKTFTDSDGKLSPQLLKTYTGEGAFYKQVLDTMQALSEPSSASLWMSYTLPADLGLPVDTLPPISTDIQVFFLSPGHPPFLLTLFDLAKLRKQNEQETPNLPGRRDVPTLNVSTQEPLRVCEEITYGGQLDQTLTSAADRQSVQQAEVEEVKHYTLQLGKLLTTALLDFCCCDFLLIPCCISVRDFSLSKLQEQLRGQSGLARQFFGGPLELSPSSYQELKAAAVAVTGVSHVPLLMSKAAAQRRDEGQEQQQQQRLVLMDPDWRAAVSLLVETLTASDLSQLGYPPGSRFKTQVAVMEAAKRLSFVDRVLLFSPDPWLLDSCRELTRRVLEDTGVTLKLRVLSPKPGVTQAADDPERPNYAILLDCPPRFAWRVPDCNVLRVSQTTVPGSGSQRMTATTMLTEDWV